MQPAAAAAPSCVPPIDPCSDTGSPRSSFHGSLLPKPESGAGNSPRSGISVLHACAALSPRSGAQACSSTSCACGVPWVNDKRKAFPQCSPRPSRKVSDTCAPICPARPPDLCVITGCRIGVEPPELRHAVVITSARQLVQCVAEKVYITPLPDGRRQNLCDCLHLASRHSLHIHGRAAIKAFSLLLTGAC
jgi:hypothetical protein